MPRVKCPKCSKVETILKSGFIRQKQRYYCKECNYNFTLNHESRKAKNKTRKNYQTTIVDIGNAMGISATTVSRALRNHPDISPATTLAVQQVALQMEYRPNLLARNFASKQTQTIGVIIPHLQSTFFSSMLGGIQKVASKNGFKVIICLSNEDYQTELENVQALMDSRVDGLLVCHSASTTAFDYIENYSKKGISIVNFYRTSPSPKTSKVLAKNTEGAEKVTEHLLEQGCKRIGIILGPKSLTITEERLLGYLNILKKNKIKPDKELIAYTDYSNVSINSVVDDWLNLDQRPDAIFCISDRSAIYVIKHLKKRKIKVPNEIAVVGFGNDLMGELIEPSLTTYNIQTSVIGETTMQLFLQQYKNEADSEIQIQTIDGDLLVRESSIKKKEK
ncbi:LacI family DNA-binding transcriptional regulator [Flavobacterium circumlabens]|uniref:LacI family DNA-binding transcriptional regulator n=1 Tax=Flavobacterium circumlabens TaxID=2133765 RepID=A0A4Y7UG43_9FLAO|nr:substrate-binding domain-containing protein [Flavobacterium circumlabens]TCN59520.1 LacI family transcriptional regulator [Flavobacterium circumlabens]TEB44812.1 LacI family DNA-binding transcriptional regulator [Flavobacterium circumlabens]